MKTYWLLSAGIAALATPSLAQAQDETTAPATGTENAAAQPADTANAANQGEIVVVAQGRRQPLQDVPLAVTAVGGQQMQNSGASDIRQLNQLAPSLLVSSTGTEANGSARIRGIGTVGDNPGLESSVAVFVDGVYRSRSGIGLNELGAVERIEVLRGPQGTLFGRNASAGIIHVITERPDFDFGGEVELTYGNYDYIRGVGGITGPIGENVAFRIDAVYVRRDGFYEVVNAANGTESRVNDRDRLFTRAQLLFEPNDSLSIRLIGDFSTRDESCCAAQYASLVETTDTTPAIPGDFTVNPTNRFVTLFTNPFFGGIIYPNGGNRYSREIAVTPGRTYRGETKDWGVSAQIDWDLGGATLTSITAYRDYDSDQAGDLDYGNVDLLFRDNDGNSFRHFQTFTQELRLQGSAFEGTLDWLVGAYFASEDLHLRDNIRFGNQYGIFSACGMVARVNIALVSPTSPGCASATTRATFASPLVFGPVAGPILIQGLERLDDVANVGDNFSNYFQESRNWAIFTHNIINITDNLSLTLGARYTSENKEFSATFNNNNTFCGPQQAAFSQFLPGGATPFQVPGNALATMSIQAFTQAIVNLTCQGNSTSALNNLALADERDEDEWSGTAVLAFRPNSRLLLYGSYSRGYKAGGFNLDRSALGLPIFAPNDPRNRGGRGELFGTGNLQFDPEINNAFEVGFKWTHRNYILNVAAFRQQFSNFQLNTFNGSVFLVQNINGCETDLGLADQDTSNPPTGANATGACPADSVSHGVTTTGIEVEAAIYPRRDLAITAGLTYADTRYRDDLVGRDTGAPLDQALFLLAGDNLSNAPKYVVTSSISWTPAIGSSGMSLLAYADARLSGDYNTGSDLFPEKEQDGYAVINARLGLRGPGQRWAIELWAQNLFDEDYDQVAFNTPFQGSFSRANIERGGVPAGYSTASGAHQFFSAFLAEPRTFGITGRFRF